MRICGHAFGNRLEYQFFQLPRRKPRPGEAIALGNLDLSAAIPTIADLAATPPATRFLINTRPTPDAGPLSDAAAAKGYRPIPCPMMTVADNDVGRRRYRTAGS